MQLNNALSLAPAPSRGSIAPVAQAVSPTAASGTANYARSWPAHQAGDLGILVVEQTAGAAAMVAPAGWTELTDSPQSDGETYSHSILQVFWRRAESAAESAVTVSWSFGHSVARMYTVRGVLAEGGPVTSATWTITEAAAQTVLPGLTTTEVNTLVVYVISRGIGGSGTSMFAAPSGDLTGLTEWAEAATAAGAVEDEDGGGFVVGRGLQIAPGATGAITVGHQNTAARTSVGVVFAIPPA
jgi:hypothetical protein